MNGGPKLAIGVQMRNVDMDANGRAAAAGLERRNAGAAMSFASGELFLHS